MRREEEAVVALRRIGIEKLPLLEARVREGGEMVIRRHRRFLIREVRLFSEGDLAKESLQ